MKKKGFYVLALLCYIAGVALAAYIGGWLMMVQPVRHLISAFAANEFTIGLLLVCVIKLVLSTTIAGVIWCIGYVGYNHFRGTEDPDWDLIMEERMQNRS